MQLNTCNLGKDIKGREKGIRLRGSQAQSKENRPRNVSRWDLKGWSESLHLSEEGEEQKTPEDTVIPVKETL